MPVHKIVPGSFAGFKQTTDRLVKLFGRNRVADEIRKLLDLAPVPVKAMILLGLNCGFGNHESATFRLNTLNLETGRMSFPRPKTGIERRCPRWPETIEVLKTTLAERPTPKLESATDKVFVTKRGGQSLSAGAAFPIVYSFGKGRPNGHGGGCSCIVLRYDDYRLPSLERARRRPCVSRGTSLRNRADDQGFQQRAPAPDRRRRLRHGDHHRALRSRPAGDTVDIPQARHRMERRSPIGRNSKNRAGRANSPVGSGSSTNSRRHPA